MPMNRAITVVAMSGLLATTAGSSVARSQTLTQEGVQVTVVGHNENYAWGTAAIDDSADNRLITYSMRDFNKTGYFYGDYDPEYYETTYFANLTDSSTCSADYYGYQGFSSLAELTDVSQLNFDTTRTIMFGVKASDCYEGLLVIRRNNHYTVFEPVRMEDGTLHLHWWEGLAPDATDFSQLPQNF